MATLQYPRNKRPSGAFKRLTKTIDYKRVYSAGNVLASPCLKLYLLSHEGAFSRLGVVVSRRVSTKATMRNRLKRVLKQWFQQHSPAAVRTKYDIVVVVKRPAHSTQYSPQHLALELQGLIHQCVT